MEGNLIQAVGSGVGLALIFGFCIWQIVSTSRAKKRRIAREQAEKAKHDGGI